MKASNPDLPRYLPYPLAPTPPNGSSRFIAETCRSEAAHWAQILAIATFTLWTPWPWALVIVAYAIASNLPCIILQRQNRLRLTAILARQSCGD